MITAWPQVKTGQRRGPCCCRATDRYGPGSGAWRRTLSGRRCHLAPAQVTWAELPGNTTRRTCSPGPADAPGGLEGGWVSFYLEASRAKAPQTVIGGDSGGPPDAIN